MKVNGPEWSQAIPTAKSLVALEIDYDSAPRNRPGGSEEKKVQLPNLRHLRLVVNEDCAVLVREIANWKLPAIQSIFLRSSQHISFDAVLQLLLNHGSGLKRLGLDSSTSGDIRLSFVLPMCGSSLECQFHENADPVVTPQTGVTTIAVRLKTGAELKKSLSILNPLRRLNWICSGVFPSLKTMVLIGEELDAFEEPHLPDLNLYRQLLHKEIQQWTRAGIAVVNRRGIPLVSDDVRLTITPEHPTQGRRIQRLVRIMAEEIENYLICAF